MKLAARVQPNIDVSEADCHRQPGDRLRCEELTPCMQPCIYSPITWSLFENEALHMGYDVTTDHTTDCSFNGVNEERELWIVDF